MSQQRGTITEHTLFSKELNEEITILVYLPPSFSPFSKYPLLITQDGKDYFQLGRIPRLADELLGKKEIENIIIAGIPYQNVQDRRRKYHPDGEQNEAYIRFLAHELVPFLDDTYPTYQMGMGRCLAGDSLGATVSLMTALQYPNIFGKIILYSPYVDEKVLKAVENNDQMHLLDIYHIIGQQETAVKMTNGQVKDFLSPNRELHLLMESKGLNPFYDEFDGNHSWKYWQSDLKRALRKMFGI
ncbi:MAG: esterase family protein [Bacillales bacterium]|nr:esterase family protein [Bacillales bacterium]